MGRPRREEAVSSAAAPLAHDGDVQWCTDVAHAARRRRRAGESLSARRSGYCGAYCSLGPLSEHSTSIDRCAHNTGLVLVGMGSPGWYLERSFAVEQHVVSLQFGALRSLLPERDASFVPVYRKNPSKLGRPSPICARTTRSAYSPYPWSLPASPCACTEV